MGGKWNFLIWWVVNFPFLPSQLSFSHQSRGTRSRARVGWGLLNCRQTTTRLWRQLRRLFGCLTGSSRLRSGTDRWEELKHFEATSLRHINLSLQAVNLQPNDARAHTNLGAILHLLGRTQQATGSYKTALNLQPDDPTTLGNLKKLGVTENSWDAT